MRRPARRACRTPEGSTWPLPGGPTGFDTHVIEEQVPHSTELHARLVGGGRYLTGPLARYALSSRWLSQAVRKCDPCFSCSAYYLDLTVDRS